MAAFAQSFIYAPIDGAWFDGERCVTRVQRRALALQRLWQETTSMLHSLAYIALLAQLAVVPTTTVHRVADAPSIIPFDTTLAVQPFAGVALDLEAGGAVRVVGGDTRTVRVQVTERGEHCADCV